MPRANTFTKTALIPYHFFHALPLIPFLRMCYENLNKFDHASFINFWSIRKNTNGPIVWCFSSSKWSNFGFFKSIPISTFIYAFTKVGNNIIWKQAAKRAYLCWIIYRLNNSFIIYVCYKFRSIFFCDSLKGKWGIGPFHIFFDCNDTRN